MLDYMTVLGYGIFLIIFAILCGVALSDLFDE